MTADRIESVEWAIRYADGDIDICNTKENALRLIASFREHVKLEPEDAELYDGATIVSRSVTVQLGEWTAS